jgi:hypothetical protein
MVLLDISGSQVEVVRDLEAPINYQHAAISDERAVGRCDAERLQESWYGAA